MPDTPLDALVLEGSAHSTLAIVRDLGRHGVRVAVGADTRFACAVASRYCQSVLRHPPLRQQPEEAAAALLAWLDRHRNVVIFPNSDRWHAICHAHESRIRDRGGVLAGSPAEKFQSTCNKGETIARARRLGVPVPPTWCPQTEAEAADLAPTLPYPVVVKARISQILRDGRFIHTGSVQYVRTPEQLLPAWRKGSAALPNPLIQGWVPGRGVGVFLLCRDGHPVMKFAHRRVRDVIPTGSASALRESIAYPQPLGDYAERLAADLLWTGPMMVEFRLDDTTGNAHLMEINGGRFWGSLQLAIDAGQHFPLTLYRLCRGEVVTDSHDYRVGIRSRWLIGDLQGLARTMRGRPAGFTGPFPTRWQALRDFLLPSGVPTRLEVLRLSDIRPWFAEVGFYLSRLFKKSG